MGRRRAFTAVDAGEAVEAGEEGVVVVVVVVAGTGNDDNPSRTTFLSVAEVFLK